MNIAVVGEGPGAAEGEAEGLPRAQRAGVPGAVVGRGQPWAYLWLFAVAFHHYDTMYRSLEGWTFPRGLADRGLLRQGMKADVVVFDPATVKDQATYENPAQYSTGIAWVLVNGQAVVANGKPTNATPGRVLHGPGYKGSAP